MSEIVTILAMRPTMSIAGKVAVMDRSREGALFKMARRRSFVPEFSTDGRLEGRVSLSIFGSIGNWFSSQYSHVKQDLGITHKKPATASDGIEQLWKASPQLSKPVPASSFIHMAHTTKVK